MTGLLCYCRAGFEPELAAELTERVALAGIAGYARASRDDGYVLFHGNVRHADDAGALSQALPWRQLVFARQKVVLIAELDGLDPRDRITPLLAALEGRGRYGELWMEHPDSNAGKPLSGLARSFGNALRPVLRQRGFLTAQPDPRLPRLHVCFVAGDRVLLGRGRHEDGAPWPLGIPRLKLRAGAPSRSALKLEEALLSLLSERERGAWIKPGMQAADLGAAPGGWTWVLARHHLRVAAIDNGPLHPQLLETGLVQHLQADGFRWSPERTLDWMVCDMVEQPRRVAQRIGDWFVAGWCRRAVFNLKLPMKQRWKEVRDDLAALEAQVAAAGGSLRWRARQLYHDREEVTVFAWLDGR